MTENAGIDETIADEQAAPGDATPPPDSTQVAEDPTGEAAAFAASPADGIDEPDEVH